ncbi:hypothetical protein Tco_0738392, partial [Tanacetum coccineum]
PVGEGGEDGAAGVRLGDGGEVGGCGGSKVVVVGGDDDVVRRLR